ncbi:MAG TPA: hypothetical protein VHE55_03525 [Fimbriimonadaceae bacterium]|nr:hypothetical protein [Fimbriimonadaceae bacterium]
MIAEVVLLAVAGKGMIASTPEWKQYQAILAKHKIIVAEVVLRLLPIRNDTPYRDGFEATFWPDGAYRASAWPHSFAWNPSLKRGLILDYRDKTYRFVVNQEETPHLMSMLGIGTDGARIGEQEVSSTLSRKSADSRHPGSQSGFEVYSYHVDAGWSATWLFDSKTHLLTQFTSDSLGPMAEETHAETRFIRWRFDTGETFSLTPPEDFRKADGSLLTPRPRQTCVCASDR